MHLSQNLLSFDLTTQSENKPFSSFPLHTKKNLYKVYMGHLKLQIKNTA